MAGRELWRARAFEQEAHLVIPISLGVMGLVGVVWAWPGPLQEGLLARLADPADLPAWLDATDVLVVAALSVLAAVVGTGAVLWTLLLGPVARLELDGDHLVARRGGLLGSARRIPLDHVAALHIYEDRDTRGSPTRVVVVPRDGRAQRWTAVSRKAAPRLREALAPLGQRVTLHEGPPPK
jgi:hypothetical protein